MTGRFSEFLKWLEYAKKHDGIVGELWKGNLPYERFEDEARKIKTEDYRGAFSKVEGIAADNPMAAAFIGMVGIMGAQETYARLTRKK